MPFSPVAIVGRWIRRLGYLLRRRAVDDELRREMEAHRALMKEPPAFGNTLRLREEARDAWGWGWLDDLVHDSHLAVRTLWHTPGFTITAIVTLAFGIGANIGMFSLVNSLFLRPLYERPHEVVAVYGRNTSPSGGYRGISYPNYLDLQQGAANIFEDLAAFSTVFIGLDVGEGARRTLGSVVTANYFPIFELPMALGRTFTPDEARLGANIRVAIISYPLWQQRAADPNIVGRTVRVNGEPFTVVGVAPEGFTGTSIPGPDVWLPLGVHDAISAVSAATVQQLKTRDAHELSVVGRLRSGISVETGAPLLTTVSRRLEQTFPVENSGYTLEMSVPSRLAFMPGPGGGAMMASIALLLMVMPAVVLLVACLNLADLLLARGQTRRHELAIRASLGGGRGRLVRQLLTEGLILALVGGAVGLMLSAWASGALLTSIRPVLPVGLSLPELDLDWRVLLGTMGFSLAASLVFGAWPAWDLTGRAVVTDLKRRVDEEGHRPRGMRIGNALVIGQVALSLLLLASG